MTTPRPPPLASAEACALVFRGGRVLIVGRGAGGLWEGFWEFPTVHVSGADPAGRSFGAGAVDLAEGVRRLTGVRAEVGPVVQTVNYGVTKHRVRLDAHEARGLTEPLTPGRRDGSRRLGAARRPRQLPIQRGRASADRLDSSGEAGRRVSGLTPVGLPRTGPTGVRLRRPSKAARPAPKNLPRGLARGRSVH